MATRGGVSATAAAATAQKASGSKMRIANGMGILIPGSSLIIAKPATPPSRERPYPEA
jgi:hypothetical protein